MAHASRWQVDETPPFPGFGGVPLSADATFSFGSTTQWCWPCLNITVAKDSQPNTETLEKCGCL